MKSNVNDIINHGIGGMIEHASQQKEILKEETIRQINTNLLRDKNLAYDAFNKSIECINNVRDFVSNPTHILGSPTTKHGEIAEHIEVEITNGRLILKGLKPIASFDGVGRTAPEDYLINGIQIQSKFCNSFNNTLNNVKDHLIQYPDFAKKGYYKIPKDQFNLIKQIVKENSVEGISYSNVKKCKNLVALIEGKTGKPFFKVVRPGICDYYEVQIGTVGKTLDRYENEFITSNKEQIIELEKESKQAQLNAQKITDPSLGEALKYGAISAAITGGMAASIKIYTKIKAGKKLTDFSIDDWKEIGIDFSINGIKGGISGLGIYTLTKVGNFSAPFAAGVASASVGIISLLVDYRKGQITKNEFADLSTSLCFEAGLSAIGASLGQTMIPIPVLGAIIGSATSKAVIELVNYISGKQEDKLITFLNVEYENSVRSFEKEAIRLINIMNSYYLKLDGYINAALSKESAARFFGSVELCRFLKVKEEFIIKSIEELDDFMTS